MKTYFLSLCFIVTICFSLQAQDNYQESIGIRGGALSAITYKRMISLAGAIEGIAGYNFTNGRIFSVTGLYEHHFFINYGLNWFAGGGLMLGANKDDFRLGIDAILGIEYTFEKLKLRGK